MLTVACSGLSLPVLMAAPSNTLKVQCQHWPNKHWSILISMHSIVYTYLIPSINLIPTDCFVHLIAYMLSDIWKSVCHINHTQVKCYRWLMFDLARSAVILMKTLLQFLISAILPSLYWWYKIRISLFIHLNPNLYDFMSPSELL